MVSKKSDNKLRNSVWIIFGIIFLIGLTIASTFISDAGINTPSITATGNTNLNGNLDIGGIITSIGNADFGNGSLFINATTGDVRINGFIKLGSNASSIKFKKLTGTTGATEGSETLIAHGLDKSKIIGLQVLVSQVSGNRIPPAFTRVSEHEFYTFIDSTNVKINLDPTNSANIVNGAITVLITHEE